MGFATVTPFTNHTFLLPAAFIANFDTKPVCLRITVEHRSWTDDVKLLQERTEGRAVENLQMTVEHFQREFLNCNLNEARRMFRLPEIEIPQQNMSNQ
jgi:hypothetical protein